MSFKLLTTFFIISLVSPLSQARTTSDIQLVKRLYRTYAWEAENARAVHRPFIDASRTELLKYLEPVLAEALLQDKACRIRTQQVCRLDFSPLWASQDPAANNLQVHRGKGKSKILVSFNVPDGPKRIMLEYDLSPMRQGVRVRDIRYADGGSLRRILGLK